jgi:hypothetical protein
MAKYDKRSACPRDLDLFIQLTNEWLPADHDERGFLNSRLLDLEVDSNVGRKGPKEIEDAAREIIGNKRVFTRLGGNPFDLLLLIDTVFAVVEASTVLEAICNANEAALESMNKSGFSSEDVGMSKYRIPLFEALLQSHTLGFPLYEIDDDGCIRPKHSGISQIFVRHTVECVRIRRCPVCEKIFWAEKVIAKTCGEKNCAAAWYERERMADPKTRAEHNEKRRLRYQSQKELKEGKKRNGSI